MGRLDGLQDAVARHPPAGHAVRRASARRPLGLCAHASRRHRSNMMGNLALLSELAIMLIVSYFPPMHAIGTRPLQIVHWFAPIPWTIIIFIYDETRKFLMRNLGKGNWFEEYTYY
jgi:hypothetical protein